MNFFKKAFSDVNPALEYLKKKSQQAYKETQDAIKEIKSKIGDKKEIPINKHLIEIMPRIYWMNFPNNDLIAQLSEHLNSTFPNNYYIWNISEHKYETFPFNNQVAEYNCAGYPNPGLGEIFLICKSIITWLKSDNSNIAIMHCQHTRGRSALIISCLLCLYKQFNHPGEALTYFCKQTHTKDQKILFPSQSLYLNYFANILNGVRLNSKPQRITRIIFNEVPKIMRKSTDNKQKQQQQDDSFRPYLQLFKEGNIIYNSLQTGKLISFYESDMTIWFDIDYLEVTEDILIRCKHFHTNQVRFPIFRMMINTNFVHDNILRLLKKDIDFTNNVQVSDKFFIDIIFADEKEIPRAQLQQQSQKQQNNNLQQQEEEEEKKQSSNKEQSNNSAKKQLQNKQQNNSQQGLQYIVNECMRKIDENTNLIKQNLKKQEEEQQIQEILDNKFKQQDSNYQDEGANQGRFSIVESDNSSDHNDKSSEDNASGGEGEGEGEVEQQVKKDEVVNKFLSDLHEDQQLDEEDINDYLENLEKE